MCSFEEFPSKMYEEAAHRNFVTDGQTDKKKKTIHLP